MRSLALYIAGQVSAVVFYVLQQHLRAHYYQFLMPPMSPALIDGLFVIVYMLCGLIMVGAMVNYGWRIYAKRRLSRPKMQAALKTSEQAKAQAMRQQAAQPRTKAFH
jgi:type VI protein secretion system component VasK